MGNTASVTKEAFQDLKARLMELSLWPIEAETLEQGTVSRKNLDKAMADLQSRLSDVYKVLGPDERRQVGEAVRTMALMMLDIQYVQTTAATGDDKVYSVETVDPFQNDVNTMLQYFKTILNRHPPELTQSCMTVLLVKMAQNKMTNQLPETNAKNWKYTQLHHYILLESIPVFKGKLLDSSCDGHFDDPSRKNIKCAEINDKPLVPKKGFSGFVTKPASSMINKLYCRRGKNKRNIIADQIRSRLVLDSAAEVEEMFNALQANCYFHHKGLDSARAPEILTAHCELVQMMLAKNPEADKYMFRIPKFHQETDFDCGPWGTLQTFPMRVHWNSACSDPNVKDVPEKSIFNFNYYFMCPQVLQTLEGLSMTAYEIQIGTKQVMDAMENNHEEYDRMRIFHSNKPLETLYNGVAGLTPEALASIDVPPEKEEAFVKHYTEFPNLTLVMNECKLQQNGVSQQDSPMMTKVGGRDPADLIVTNYQGRWGANYPGYFLWRYDNKDPMHGGKRLRYIKRAVLWGSDQQYGTEGHCHCSLVATRGDFQVVIHRSTLHHAIEEHRFVNDYKIDDGQQVVLGDLKDYDAVQLVLHSAPYPGCDVRGYGFDVVFSTD